jgi:hypothetical protein
MHPSRCRGLGVGGAVALAGLALGGCATPIAQEDLKVPAQLTCFELAAPASYLEERGLLKYTWETRLERGPYVAERVDANGTFYRAPPGGVSIARQDALSLPANLLTHMTYDGGVWIPHDPAGQPHLYNYFTTEAVPPVVPPAGSSCANVEVARNPNTQGVDTVAYGVAGAVGGATGGLLARGAGTTGMSYGKAAGTGAVGGAVGGVLVAALINMDVGKIVQRPPDHNVEFVRTILAAAAHAAPLPQAPAASAASPN